MFRSRSISPPDSMIFYSYSWISLFLLTSYEFYFSAWINWFLYLLFSSDSLLFSSPILLNSPLKSRALFWNYTLSREISLFLEIIFSISWVYRRNSDVSYSAFSNSLLCSDYKYLFLVNKSSFSIVFILRASEHLCNSRSRLLN